MLFPVERAHSAYCYRCPVGKKRESCRIDCADHLNDILERGHNEIAAVIVEPLVQGAGGMIIHPIEFLQKVREACSRWDVLLIADEVFTGFGRTGRMFACQHAGIEPDLMCLSKGITGGVMALGATAATEQIYQAFLEADSDRTFYHGHSFTGNPLACAAANASLEIFETEPVFERIAAIEAIHRERLAALRQHPAVGNTRQLGTIAAVELVATDAGYSSSVKNSLYRFFLDKGILLRPLGNVVYIVPPYAISPDALQRIWDAIVEALDSVPAP
jgi:adenosylmethionine-8-amino-7-oxononanoate aminotransferase